jgi:hypothetical protein
MSNCPNAPSQDHSVQKVTKCCAVISTIIYALSFPFLAAGAPFLGGEVFKSLGFFAFLIPITLPVSIILMWSSYTREKYYRSLVFCSIPLVTWYSFKVLDMIIRALN